MRLNAIMEQNRLDKIKEDEQMKEIKLKSITMKYVYNRKKK